MAGLFASRDVKLVEASLVKSHPELHFTVEDLQTASGKALSVGVVSLGAQQIKADERGPLARVLFHQAQKLTSRTVFVHVMDENREWSSMDPGIWAQETFPTI